MKYSVAYGIAYKGEGSLEDVIKLADERMYQQKAETKAKIKATQEAKKSVRINDTRGEEKSLKKAKKASQMPTGFVVGVFGLTRGAGSSQMAIELAERYAREGLNVAMVEYDGKDALEYIGTDTSKVTYKCPTKFEREKTLLKTMGEKWDIVILDIGTPYKLNAKGYAETIDEERVSELLRCKIKVGVGFANLWNFGKLEYFEDKEEFNKSTVFSLLGYEDVEIETNLFTCNRNSEEVKDIVENLL